MSAEHLFKIVTIGNGKVGKTSPINHFAEGKFREGYLSALKVDIASKLVNFGDRSTVKLILADNSALHNSMEAS